MPAPPSPGDFTVEPTQQGDLVKLRFHTFIHPTTRSGGGGLNPATELQGFRVSWKLTSAAGFTTDPTIYPVSTTQVDSPALPVGDYMTQIEWIDLFGQVCNRQKFTQILTGGAPNPPAPGDYTVEPVA